jgi:hypothetical protein
VTPTNDSPALPPVRAWTAPIPTPEQRAAQLTESERTAERDRLWDMLRTLGSCATWMAVGLVLVGWALHTTDLTWAGAVFWGGLIVGNSGILVSLALAYRRGEERGDW